MSEPLKPADYARRARGIEAAAPAGSPPVRLAVLSSFTAELLRPYLVVEADAIGLRVAPWFGPFDQLEPQVLDDASPLWREPRDVVWLALRVEDADPGLVDELPDIGAARAAKRLREVRERLVDLTRAVRERSGASVLVSNFACPAGLDTFDASDPDGLVHLVAAENRELARALAAVPGAHVFDWAGVAAESGTPAFCDAKLWYLARAPVAAAAQPFLARRLARAVRALLWPAAKCLVVDLDNTLWGGVLGDDGPDGIQLGGAYPGAAYQDFQRALAQLRRRGFLLAVASKNDEALVRETLERHPEMVLRATDFAAIVASWDPKPASLRRIAETLNLGLDALVLVDDNPVERAQVRAELPMVQVIDLPDEPAAYVETLRALAVLDRPRLLADDRARAARYAEDADRRERERSAPSLADFLRELGMTAEVGACGGATAERIHQLLHKTNQFNLTTRRHGEGELQRLGAAPDGAVRWLRLRDRHGDLGLVCVGIVRREGDGVGVIDTLLMSCRVMGRGVEDAFLSHLLEIAEALGARRVRGIYRPTGRNGIVAAFFPERGFAEVARTGDEVVYEIDPARRGPWPAHIHRIDADPA